MKSDAERGVVGAWARHARIDAGYPTAKSAWEAARAAGVDVTLGHLQSIEAGWDRAGRELLLSLGKLYRSAPPVEPERSALSPAQAAEIRAVVAEAVASAFDARLERIERLLGDLAGDRAPARRPPARRP